MTGQGVTCDSMARELDLPRTQVNVALEFMKKARLRGYATARLVSRRLGWAMAGTGVVAAGSRAGLAK